MIVECQRCFFSPLISIVYSETSGGQAEASLKKIQITGEAVTVRLCVSPCPTAQRQRGHRLI